MSNFNLEKSLNSDSELYGYHIINDCNGNWEEISKHPDLDFLFIDIYSDKLNWDSISQYQELTENDVREFVDLVNWNNIYCYQENISNKFLKEFSNKLSYPNWV